MCELIRQGRKVLIFYDNIYEACHMLKAEARVRLVKLGSAHHFPAAEAIPVFKIRVERR